MAIVSIIAPVLNEEKIIEQFCQHLSDVDSIEEVIIVDGGSTDKTAEIASKYYPVINSKAGRARQMNTGAKYARGEILLFVHADTNLHENALLAIKESIRDNINAGGFFRIKFEDKKLIYRIIELFSDWRARLFGAVFGDQGIFIRREIFEKVGGFPEIAILEDWEFIKKVKKYSRIVRLPLPIYASVRRYEKTGKWKTIWDFQKIKLLYSLGVHPNSLKSNYKEIR